MFLQKTLMDAETSLSKTVVVVSRDHFTYYSRNLENVLMAFQKMRTTQSKITQFRY